MTTMTEDSAGLGDASRRGAPRLLSKEEIVTLSRIDNRIHPLICAVEASLIAVSVWVCETFWSLPVYVLAVFVIGSRIQAFGATVHDAVHYRVFTNRRLNDIFGEIAALPLTLAMAGYRATHYAHHRELNSDADPDWAAWKDRQDYTFPASRPTVWARIAGFLFATRVPIEVYNLQSKNRKYDYSKTVKRARLIFFVSLVAASIAFGFWKGLLLYWAVPFLTAFLMVRYIRSIAEHYAIGDGTGDPLDESRTVVASFWETWLIAPWGLNYHLEHHLYPAIPCYRLAEAHRILMTRPAFAQRARITRGYFGGLLRECATVAPSPRRKIVEAEAMVEAEA